MTVVTFGDVDTTQFTFVSDSQINVTVPARVAGMVDVRVTTEVGRSAQASADHFTYNAAPAPVVISLDTTSGPLDGGTLVNITGSYLTGAAAVLFGGVPADYQFNSDSSITAWSPQHASALVDVQVVTPTGTSATGSGDQFYYIPGSAPTITSITPSSGSTAGGTVVTIIGTGFTTTAAVSFGLESTQNYQVISDTSMTVTSPMESAGAVDITVSTESGPSGTSGADVFTYNNFTDPFPRSPESAPVPAPRPAARTL